MSTGLTIDQLHRALEVLQGMGSNSQHDFYAKWLQRSKKSMKSGMF